MYVQAHRMLNREEFSEAVRRFTTIVRIEPEFARAWDGRGQAKMYKGDLEEAMIDFDRAISLRPRVGQLYGNRAQARYALGDTRGAERDARRAVELDDELIEAHIVIARAYAERGNFNAALPKFDHAVELDPTLATSYWRRGRFYRDDLRDGQNALSDFNAAIRIDPVRGGYYIDRGILLISLGMYSEAKWDMEEAISLAQDPKLPNIIEAAQSWIDLIDENIPDVEPVQLGSQGQ